MVLVKISVLGSEGIWICKGRGIRGYEMECQKCELDNGHFERRYFW